MKTQMIASRPWAFLALALACGRTGAKSGEPVGSAPAHASSDAAAAMTSDALPATDTPAASPDLANSNCGNGHLDPGEECDDGNTVSNDGCTQLCKVECDWCPGPPHTINLTVCGNAILTSNEVCDDGNINSGDGCAGDCQAVESGYVCPVPGRRCTPICGDGRVLATETCDDGNTFDGDGCSSYCLTEQGWDCSSGTCVRLVSGDGGAETGADFLYCGDGLVSGAEQCDEGPQNRDDVYGGCNTHCSYIYCGDGTVNGPEECDLGQANNRGAYGDRTGCTSSCKLPPYCGDGIVEYGEECDLGNFNGTSGTYCDSRCHYILP